MFRALACFHFELWHQLFPHQHPYPSLILLTFRTFYFDLNSTRLEFVFLSCHHSFNHHDLISTLSILRALYHLVHLLIIARFVSASSSIGCGLGIMCHRYSVLMTTFQGIQQGCWTKPCFSFIDFANVVHPLPRNHWSNRLQTSRVIPHPFSRVPHKE